MDAIGRQAPIHHLGNLILKTRPELRGKHGKSGDLEGSLVEWHPRSSSARHSP